MRLSRNCPVRGWSWPERVRRKAACAPWQFRQESADRVHFAGSVKPGQLAVLLAAADVMVLTSEREGLANAWVEALACGAPLVISDVGGAREVLRDDSAGRIVERNAAAIATGVREVLAAPPAQDAVAAHAARFSWEDNAAQLAAHFRRIAGMN